MSTPDNSQGLKYDPDKESAASLDQDMGRMFEHRTPSASAFPKIPIDYENSSPPPLYPGEGRVLEEHDFEARHRLNCPSIHEPLSSNYRQKGKPKKRTGSGTLEDGGLTGEGQDPAEDGHTGGQSDAAMAAGPSQVKYDAGRGESSINLSSHALSKGKSSEPSDLESRRRKGSEVELALYTDKAKADADALAALNPNDRDQVASHRFENNPGVSRTRYNRTMSSPTIISENKISLAPADHTPHELFVELDELTTVGQGAEAFWEWKEKARWIKFEEDVLESAGRWDKPHVASLSFHSLLELRKGIETGVILLDAEAKTFADLLNNIVGSMLRNHQIREDQADYVLKALSVRHSHLFDKKSQFHKSKSHGNLRVLDSVSSRMNLKRHLHRQDGADGVAIDMEDTCVISNPLAAAKAAEAGGPMANSTDLEDIHSPLTTRKNGPPEDGQEPTEYNMDLLRKIPANAQVASILVGTMEELTKPTFAFVRLREASHLHNLAEVPLPVRFIFVCLGPLLQTIDYVEVGRSISTLMADKNFHDQVYAASDRMGIIQAMNGFLDDSMVLPPGDFDKSTLMPMLHIARKGLLKRKQLREQKEQGQRAVESKMNEDSPDGGGGGDEEEEDDPLRRTKRPFGGVINDIKKRYPKYWSDIRDGLNLQCLSAFIFIYFAALAPAITFGGLIADKTDGHMGASEMMLASAVGGLAFSLFAGQPLLIVGATGPLLVFEESMYKFCKDNAIEFMTFRIWIGLWVLIISLVIVGVEGSFLVRYISRFTQEIFAFLISLIFILETFFKLGAIFGEHPLSVPNEVRPTLVPLDENWTVWDENGTSLRNYTNVTLYGDAGISHEPNTALLSLILTIGTFGIAWWLKDLRNKKILGRTIRRALGDFGVPLAIMIMVLLDYFIQDVYTTKLSVPEGFAPTNTAVRGWFIPPLGKKGDFPGWLIAAAVVPALLVFILIFMESQITGMILNKKDNNLKKGTGFHLDMVILGVLTVVCGFVGLPFVCCATVRSVSHISALMVWSKNNAPGEPQKLVGVVEQRITGFAVSVVIGISVLLAVLLQHIPVAVLFGVFLYMGIASLGGIQLYERLQLFITPQKHYPDIGYVRNVKRWRIHMFTGIQVLCLGALWAIKSTEISLAFPFLLILMVPLRKFVLPRIFSEDELNELDKAGTSKGGVETTPQEEEEDADFYEIAHMPD